MQNQKKKDSEFSSYFTGFFFFFFWKFTLFKETLEIGDNPILERNLRLAPLVYFNKNLWPFIIRQSFYWTCAQNLHRICLLPHFFSFVFSKFRHVFLRCANFLNVFKTQVFDHSWWFCVSLFRSSTTFVAHISPFCNAVNSAPIPGSESKRTK